MFEASRYLIFCQTERMEKNSSRTTSRAVLYVFICLEKEIQCSEEEFLTMDFAKMLRLR